MYGAVPPVAITVASPSQAKLQEALLPDADAVNITGSVIVTEAVASHPFASVAVTLYVPAHKPEISSVVWPPGLQVKI